MTIGWSCRHYRRWEFCQNGTKLPGVRLYVDKAEVFSRPKKDVRGNTFEFREVLIDIQIIHDLMGFYAQSSLPENFVSELWKQSWAFSSTLLELR